MVFYRPQWSKQMNLKMNFKYFQIQKWILQRGRAEKADERNNGIIWVIVMFPSWVMILKLSKKCIFSILCRTQQKNLSILKQFTFKKHMPLEGLFFFVKGLVTLFQKMVLFIMLWPNVLKKLMFEIKEFC